MNNIQRLSLCSEADSRFSVRSIAIYVCRKTHTEDADRTVSVGITRLYCLLRTHPLSVVLLIKHNWR